MNDLRKKAGFLRAGVILAFFLFIALAVYFYKSQPAYLFLFGGIGIFSAVTEFAIAVADQKKQQLIRKVNLLSIAALLVSLALIIGINFQYKQVFVDLYSAVVTGALIQFVIARLLLPLLFGNIFCSRVCWDGAAFEFLEPSSKKKKQYLNTRTSFSLLFLILITVASCFSIVLHNFSAPTPEQSRINFAVANIVIIIVGIVLAKIFGSRAYCRKICPFITVSGILAPFSFFKITPVNHHNCRKCGKCSKVCPMHIDVMKYVVENNRVSHPDCIMCEQCVSACPTQCIMVLPPFSLQKSIGK
jgi:polyferredoxin